MWLTYPMGVLHVRSVALSHYARDQDDDDGWRDEENPRYIYPLVGPGQYMRLTNAGEKILGALQTDNQRQQGE